MYSRQPRSTWTAAAKDSGVNESNDNNRGVLKYDTAAIGQQRRSGYLSRKYKKACERKLQRKEYSWTRFGSPRYGGDHYRAPRMVVSNHAKQRFRERGRFTIPVYRDKESITLVVTYIPQSDRWDGVLNAYATIRLQLDHLNKYAKFSSRWSNPRLPRYDAIIWETSKNIVKKRTIRRRKQGYQRFVDWSDHIMTHDLI